MKQIFPGIYHTEADRPFDNEVQTRAYFIQLETANFLFYSSSHIQRSFELIESLGGISAQYLNHRHEASPHCDSVRNHFNAPLICHEKEREAVAEQCRVSETFSERHRVTAQFEVIPTPGHCPGSSCYLLNRNGTNILLTGDTLYPVNSEWEIYLMSGSSSAAEMISSLQQLALLEVDLLLPGLHIGDQAWEEVSGTRWQYILERCMVTAEEALP